jgi:adenylate cyclase
MDPASLSLEEGRLRAGEQVVPVDNINRAMIGFWGPQGTFKTYSYADVLRGKYPESEFKDKIVLIGVTNPASHDEKPTPYTTSNLILSGSLETPGVEIHASAVQSFLDGRWYRTVPSLANAAFLLLCGLLTALAVGGRGPWRGLAGALLVVVLAGGLAFGLWRYCQLWLNFAAPLAIIALTYVLVTAADFLTAEMARRKTRAAFSRYVSPAVVEELMSNPDSIALGGQRRDLTIMFVDIRGFTAYSENKAPEQVVSRLNEYLTAMTGVIFRYGGTLDKYLGDGLMAIFGAPVFFPDHVQRSIQAAIEIQEVIDKLNRAWVERNEPPLKIGVGINTGSVLVGNVGSPDRMDYTVIGEDVNLASRVEGLTKTFGTLVIISERSVRTLEGAGDLPWELKYLGTAEVKGFTLPVGVYTVLDKNTGGLYT